MTIVLAMCFSPMVFAQQIPFPKLPPQGVVNTIEKANILIALDTSISMEWNMTNNSTAPCGQNKRMYVAAQTIRNLVTGFQNVANFGLIRWNSGSANDDFRPPFAAVPISTLSNQQILDITTRYLSRCSASAAELRAPGGTDVNNRGMGNVRQYVDVNRALFTGSCKRTLVLLISDGAWGDGSCDPNLPISSCPARNTRGAATQAANLRNNFGITTTTIGITESGVLSQYQFVSTAGGGGKALLARNQVELQNEIQNKLTTFLADAFTATAPAVMPSTTAGNLIYQPTFEYRRDGQWKGLLKAYKLDISGSSASLQWEAGQKLLGVDPAIRNLWTVGSGLPIGSYRNFTEANVTSLRRLLNPLWTSSTNDGVARTLIRFVQGYDIYNEESVLPQDRRWVLGDIYNSKPVYVGPPQNRTKDDPDMVGVIGYFEQISPGAFTRYVNNWAGRQPILLAASNTGVLHAFDPNPDPNIGGRELWGFIPPPILDKLNQMSGSGKSVARYMIDGSITARDVFVNGQWRTYVAFSYGLGARALTVMDVTNSMAPTHVFSVENVSNGNTMQVRYWDSAGNLSFPSVSGASPFRQYLELGYSKSTPIFSYGKNISNTYASVLVIGGGQANPSTLVSAGASILKPQTGNLGYVINLDGAAIDILGTNNVKPGAVVRTLAAHNPPNFYSGCPNCLVPTNQLITDFELIEGGQTSRTKGRYGFQLFMPNFAGAVQTVDLSAASPGYSMTAPAEITNFAPEKFGLGNTVTQENDRMLTVPISISTLTHRKSNSDLNLTFGTGDMTNLSLSGKKIDNRVYSLQDSEAAIMAGSSFSVSDLVSLPLNQTACPMPTGRKGWTLVINSLTARDSANNSYSLSNGKVASKILQYGGSTVIPIYVPRNDGQCSIGNSAVVLRDTACGFDKQSQVFANSMIGGVTVLGETLVIGISGNAGTSQLGNFRKTDNLIIGKGTFDSSGSGSVNIYNKQRVR
jgi:Tfp pilus tip-associated adhesin PilY1